MIFILEPWLFHLLLSIVILVVAFLIGTVLHIFLKKKEKTSKKAERLMAFLLAISMAALYVYVTEAFTDRASQGERILKHTGTERVEKAQVVIIPFGDYVVLERLYDFGYVVEDEWDGQTIRITIDVEDDILFLKEYREFIEGNHFWTNQARFRFQEAYENEWKEALQGGEDLPALQVKQEVVS